MTTLRVLVLEPYYGGSHQQFLENWQLHSRHAWTVCGLPAYKWKWRMRHSSITIAEQTERLANAGSHWDVVLASDMLNLAEWRGLVGANMGRLPAVVYFHENQLTYPDAKRDPRDDHYAFSNFISSIAADEVWFNSWFHHGQWFTALGEWLERMPDFQPFSQLEQVKRRATVQPPGVRLNALPIENSAVRQTSGPLRILWNARWEHDKNPNEFFAALERLIARRVPFRVDVAGQTFRNVPKAFQTSREWLGDHIDQWGFVARRADYEQLLARADVVVATAHHEFFGIAIVEAMMAGAYPLMPCRLAYPELLNPMPQTRKSDYFYEGGTEGLAFRLKELADRKQAGQLWQREAGEVKRVVARFDAARRAAEMDAALERLVQRVSAI